MKREDFKSLSVDKIISFDGIITCLLSGQNKVSGGDFAISIESPTDQLSVCGNKFIFIASPTISDISISSSGRLWAVDLHGTVYYSKEVLNSQSISNESKQFLQPLPESCESLVKHIPVCVTGEDDDLWIATYKGGLIHYDGSGFSLHTGVPAPIRFKEIAGHKFLMGCHSQILCYKDGYWAPVMMDNSIPEGATISDITMLGDVLIAVTTNGLILKQKEDGDLTLMYRSLGMFWHSCDVNSETIYLAAGEKGAYKIKDKEIVHIDKSPTFSVHSVKDIVFFPRTRHFNFGLSYYNVTTKKWGSLSFQKKEAST